MSPMKFLRRSSLLAGVTFGVMALAPSSSSAHEPVAHDARAMGAHRLISTQGVGEIRIRPDSFRVTVGVEAQADTVEQAQSEVSTRTKRVIQAINRLRINGLVLQTQTLQLYPVYAPQRGDELPKIVGYRAVNNVTATVRGPASQDLGTQAARVVDASVRAGANQVSGIDFFASDLGEAHQRALQAAVADAQRNAKTMADAAGVALGALASLDGSPEIGGPIPHFRALESRAGASSATPVEAGEIVVTARVAASFVFQAK